MDINNLLPVTDTDEEDVDVEADIYPTPLMDRPLPDLRPLETAPPLPVTDTDEEDGVLPLPLPPSVQDVGRQTACSSEEDLGCVMDGRERRVMSCVSGRVAEEELEEEAASDSGTDADTEDEVEAGTHPMGTDERLDQLELDFWKLMGLPVPVPLGALCVAGVGAVAWMMMVATVATRPCLGV